MRRSYKNSEGKRITYEQPYSVLSSEIATPAEMGMDDGEFRAVIWGLAKYVPADARTVLAMFGAFSRNGRHVFYDSCVIFEDGKPIHDPYSEMLDDIAYLLNGGGEIW